MFKSAIKTLLTSIFLIIFLKQPLYAQQLVDVQCDCGEVVVGFDAAGFIVCRPLAVYEPCAPSFIYNFIPALGTGPDGRVYKQLVGFSNQYWYPGSPYGSLDHVDIEQHQITIIDFQKRGIGSVHYLNVIIGTENLPIDYVQSIEFVEAGLLYDFAAVSLFEPSLSTALDGTGGVISGTIWQFNIPQSHYDTIQPGTNYTVNITLGE